MKELQDLLNSILPPVSEEDMLVAVAILVQESDEETKKMAEEDPIHRKVKEIYSQLFMDAFDHGLDVELCEMRAKHPKWNIVELDYNFRREYDIY